MQCHRIHAPIHPPKHLLLTLNRYPGLSLGQHTERAKTRRLLKS